MDTSGLPTTSSTITASTTCMYVYGFRVLVIMGKVLGFQSVGFRV